MSKREKNIGAGNEYFFSGEKVGKTPFTISKEIRKKKRHTIGKLGTGILRPPKTGLKEYKKPKSIRQYSLGSKSALSDSDSTKRMVKQIEDSIQARIDKAKAEEQKEAANKDEKDQDKSMNPTLKWSLIIGGFALVIGGIVWVARKKNIKAKTE